MLNGPNHRLQRDAYQLTTRSLLERQGIPFHRGAAMDWRHQSAWIQAMDRSSVYQL
jgi:hypothetical protein